MASRLAWSLRTLICAVLLCLAFKSCWAQDKGIKPADDPLAIRQKNLAEQILRLEALLLRSADIEAIDNPTRAALLQQAAQLSKQTQLSSLLDKASENLGNKQFSEAIDQQKASREALQRLVELLQSENREKRVREQRDQVRRWIEDADRLLRMQSSLRGRTEGGQDTSKAAEDQARLSDKAQQISKDLEGDSGKDKPSKESAGKENSGKSSQAPSGEKSKENSNSADPAEKKDPAESDKNSDKKSDADKNSDKKSDAGVESKDPPNKANDPSKPESSEKSGDRQSDGKPSENGSEKAQPKEGDDNQGQPNSGGKQASPSGKQSKPNQPSKDGKSQKQDGKSQQSQSGESQSGESQSGESQEDQQSQKSQPQQPQTPAERAQKKIQEAQQRMKEAEQELKEAKRQDAVEKQREAEENLKQAIQQLEEILRQLREEEVKRSLETLATRLRRMLEIQSKINEETQRLHEIAGEQPDRQILARASSMAREQQKVTSEGERALLLLKEEGSSAAFPEALVQVNRDAATVTNRLDTGDVGKVTLVIQADIVQALEEMVEALAKIKKENEDKEKKQRQQQQQGGGQMDPSQQPLINKLAELRLIRTLQLRVNKRTSTLSQMLENPSDPVGQAKAKDLAEQLRDLSKRQENIEGVTRKVASDNN